MTRKMRPNNSSNGNGMMSKERARTPRTSGNAGNGQSEPIRRSEVGKRPQRLEWLNAVNGVAMKWLNRIAQGFSPGLRCPIDFVLKGRPIVPGLLGLPRGSA